jgi:long-subunit fatty acid transport protein
MPRGPQEQEFVVMGQILEAEVSAQSQIWDNLEIALVATWVLWTCWNHSQRKLVDSSPIVDSQLD